MNVLTAINLIKGICLLDFQFTLAAMNQKDFTCSYPTFHMTQH